MQFDLMVVGGGIVGAMTGHFASIDHPRWRIGVVDRSLGSMGATGHSAGLDLPYGQTAAKRRQSAVSRRLYAELRRTLPGLPLFELPLLFVVSAARRAELEEGLAAGVPRDATGEEIDRLGAAIPELRLPEGMQVVAGCPGGYGDAGVVARTLLANLRRSSAAAIWEGTEVREVRPIDGHFVLSTADGRQVEAARVVVATGPWMRQGPAAEAASAVGLKTKKIVALHVDRAPRGGEPIVYFFDDDAFLLPLADRGHWLFSFSCQTWDVEPTGPEMTISSEDRRHGLQVLARYCPAWPSLTHSGRVFCDAYSPDRTPIAHRMAPNLVLAGGCSGSGFRLAPALAQEALTLLSTADAGAHVAAQSSTAEAGGSATVAGGAPAAARSDRDDVPHEAAGRRRRVLITATPPTPNGDLHLGHLSGPYLAADVHKRYLISRGTEALYLSGIDDHQSYTTRKAEQIGEPIAAVARRFGDRMVQTLGEAAIEVDHIGRPDVSPHHATMVRQVLRDLWDRDRLIAREAPNLHCAKCDRYLFEAFVAGRCPHCGRPACGNSCEDCGRPNQCTDLIEPRCLSCGGVPETRVHERLFLPLEPYRDAIGRRLASASAGAHLRSLWHAMAAEPLPEIAVSHLSEWGIPVPVDRYSDQRIYVWFEMAAGFLAAGQELAERMGLARGWRDLWASEDTEIVQFFGFDNGYFHAVLFPAVFAAWDAEIRPPSAFVVNEFYRLEGEKFSTSRNHAVWGGDVLPHTSVDALRFYLAWSGPETERTNFVAEEFAATVRSELDGHWRSWLRELDGRLREATGGRIPAAAPATREQAAFLELLGGLRDRAAVAYEAATFSPQRAMRCCAEIVREARRFAAAESCWVGTPDRREAQLGALTVELAAARLLAVASAPVMPRFGAALLEALSAPSGGWEDALSPLTPGTVLSDLDGMSFPLGRE